MDGVYFRGGHIWTIFQTILKQGRGGWGLFWGEFSLLMSFLFVIIIVYLFLIIYEHCSISRITLNKHCYIFWRPIRD